MQNAIDSRSERPGQPAESGTKNFKLPLIIALIALLVGGGGAGWFFWQQSQNSAAKQAQIDNQPTIKTITALGKLQPQGEVIKLSAPTSTNGNRVDQLLVKEGDVVQAGQTIAVLDSHDRLQAAAEEAERQVALARAKLAQIKAGAKSGEIGAQSAKSQQAQIELQKDRATQTDEITRVQAQWEGDRVEQSAKLQQVRVELQNDRASQVDEIVRVKAQWDGDHTTQLATIRRLEASLNNAKSEFDRNRQLQADGVISNSLLDSKRLALDTAQQQLAEAQAILNRINLTGEQQLNQAKTKLQRINSSGQQQLAASQAVLNRINLTGKQQLNQAQTKLQRTNLSGGQQVASAQSTLAQVREVRTVDVNTAQAEVDRTIANAKQAKASLEQSLVKAPQSGEVLYIHTRPGEVVSSNGIVEIGQTEQMEAIAEVYQSDVSKVRVGQRVRVSSEAIEGELIGTVSKIGSQVRRQTIVNTDPSTNIDARIVEVHVQLDRSSSQKAAKSTNLQVRVTIEQ
jgi:HlyD family secretion protein